MSKANPIKATITPVPRLPAHVVIYKIPASPFWWTRCYAPTKRYVIRSTKTENKAIALQFARQNFYDSLTTALPPRNVTPKSFRAVALSLLDREKATGKNSLYVNDEGKLNGAIFEHFGTAAIRDITHQDLNAFLIKLRDKNLAPATKKHYLGLLKKVFKHAIALQVIDRMPLFPTLGEKLQTAQKRDYLTFGEYTKLSKTIARLEKLGMSYRGTPITSEFKYLINFMINSFIRPSDLRVLKHQHVTRRNDADRNVAWLTLRHPATKTTALEVQTMPNAVSHYNDLIAFRKQRHATGASEKDFLDPGDYVFLPEFENRNTAMEKLGKIFSLIVKESGLRESTGKNLTLYSLRHTAIMYRLQNSDIDYLSLAKNARTSQAVIEQFYGSHYTTEDARVKLHAFTDRPAKKKARS